MCRYSQSSDFLIRRIELLYLSLVITFTYCTLMVCVSKVCSLSDTVLAKTLVNKHVPHKTILVQYMTEITLLKCSNPSAVVLEINVVLLSIFLFYLFACIRYL